MVTNKELLEEMKIYAEENNVPIMTEEGINFMINYIKKHNVKRILEIGAAIGYSAKQKKCGTACRRGSYEIPA